MHFEEELQHFIRRRYNRKRQGTRPDYALAIVARSRRAGKGTLHGLAHPHRCRAIARSSGEQCKNFAHSLNVRLGAGDEERFKCLFHSSPNSWAKKALQVLRAKGLVRGWRGNLKDKPTPPVGPIPAEFRRAWAAAIDAAAHGEDRSAEWLWHHLSELCARLQVAEITAGELYRAMTVEVRRMHERQASKTYWKSPEGRAEARKRALNPAYSKRARASEKASVKPKTTTAAED